MVFTEKNGNRDRGNGSPEKKDERPIKVPWVTWIAIALGVFMTGIGILLLLWGFMWQTEVGEPRLISDDELRGGPCLIPVGVVMVTLGILWVLTGWRGFRKEQDPEDLIRCPYCGKKIEPDLNFCYYCNRTFDDRKTTLDNKDDPNAGEGAGPTRKAKPFSPGKDR